MKVDEMNGQNWQRQVRNAFLQCVKYYKFISYWKEKASNYISKLEVAEQKLLKKILNGGVRKFLKI